MTKAQYRFLKRLIRGEKLPVSRYRPEHATVAAHLRRKHIHKMGIYWDISSHGKDAMARRKPKKVEETHAEP